MEESEISVIYVDDEQALLDIGKIFIEKSGNIKVTTVKSVDEALRILKEKSFDCIISDYQMPGTDGIEFLKYLKEKEYNIPFILFTGKGREDVVIEAVNNGADFYVQKGGEPKSQFTELVHKIRHSISARKSAENLIKSEKKYRNLVENSYNFIFSYDTENRFTSANQSLCNFFGMSEEDIVGKNYQELGFPAETYNYLYELHEKVRETGEVVRADSSIKMPDGILYHYKVVFMPVFDENGLFSGIMGNSADITDKINAEKQLLEKNHALLLLNEDLSAAEEEIRQQFDEIAKAQHSLIETNQYMENLFDHSASLILVWDNSFKITKANLAVEKLTGISAEKLTGLLLDDIITGAKRIEIENKIKNHESVNHIKGFETQIKNSEGKIRIVIWDIAKITDYSGKHISTTAQGQDITEIIDYQKLLLEKNNKLLLAYEEITAAEEELRQQMDEIVMAQRIIQKSEKRMHDIMNLLPDPTFAIDASGNIILWNASIAEIYGKSSYEMLGRNYDDCSKLMYGYCRPTLAHVILNYNEDQLKKYCRLFSYNNGKLEGYASFKNSEGKEITLWGIATLLYNEEGRVEGAIETFRDITEIETARIELERRNEELYAAEEEIRQQFEETAKAQHELIEKNQYMENLFNNSASLVLVWDNNFRITKANGPIETLTGISEKDLKKLRINDILSPDKINELILKLNDPENKGHITGFELSMKSVLGEDRKIVWNIARIFDYSGRHISTTAQGHDITDVLEYQNSILKKNEEMALLQEELRQANSQLKLLTGLTRHDILNSIMAAEGYIELLSCSEELNRDLYFNKLNSMISKIQKQIEFTREFENIGSDAQKWQNLFDIFKDINIIPEIPLIHGGLNVEIYADSMLRIVFENLLDNAVRHGGKKISHVQTECRISDEGELHILWMDDGRGIPEAEKEKIFERGYGSNTGLGLFLVREILGMSGIRIRETGLPGNGARFEIIVPCNNYRVID